MICGEQRDHGCGFGLGLVAVHQVGDEALASLRALDPGDAQGLAVEGAGAVEGELLDAAQLFVGDGLVGEGIGGARLVEERDELFFVQAGHDDSFAEFLNYFTRKILRGPRVICQAIITPHHP